MEKKRRRTNMKDSKGRQRKAYDNGENGKKTITFRWLYVASMATSDQRAAGAQPEAGRLLDRWVPTVRVEGNSLPSVHCKREELDGLREMRVVY